MEYVKEYLNDHKYKFFCLITLTSSLYLFKRKYFMSKFYNPSASNVHLADKKILITGANCGIGFETALALTKQGASVILACRSLEKAQLAMSKIKLTTASDKCTLELVDLANMDSVKELGTRLIRDEIKIDVLINNAGVMACPFELTQNGYESQFQVNYLSHYLLTRILLDKNVIKSDGRIINVTSKLYETAKLNWSGELANHSKAMSKPDWYDPTNAYKQSKLCNILFANYLQQEYLPRINSPNIQVYSVSPGVVLTNLGRHIYANSSILIKIAYVIFYPIMWYLMKSPLEGSQTSVYCALHPDLMQKTDHYFRNLEQFKLKENACNKEDGCRLWELSESFVKKWL